MTTIVKVQRPLATNETTPHVLVYSRDRSIDALMPVTADDLKSLFGRDRMKVYVKAEMRGTILHLGERVAEQSW